MLRCAFLTLDDATGFVIDDELAYPPLTALGWRVETISWRTPSQDWRAFDAIVIRSTWDYITDPDAFLAVLAEIEGAGIPLFNALDLVPWSIRKTYLRDLAERGVAVVPTIWCERLDPGELPALIEKVGSEEVVIKPVVGLNAQGIFDPTPIQLIWTLDTRKWLKYFVKLQLAARQGSVDSTRQPA